MMARVTQVYSIDEVARRIGESLDLIEIVSWNDDNIDYGEMIRDQFDVLYEEASRTGSGRVMCVSLHPYLVGQPNKHCPIIEIFQYSNL